MARVLIVLTDEAEAAADVLRRTPGSETVDLRDGDPDYNLLLDKIFAAESVQIW